MILHIYILFSSICTIDFWISVTVNLEMKQTKKKSEKMVLKYEWEKLGKFAL